MAKVITYEATYDPDCPECDGLGHVTIRMTNGLPYAAACRVCNRITESHPPVKFAQPDSEACL